MEDNVVEIDVRPLLEQGRSPLPLIVNTAASLQEGQCLRLLTAWEPLPLYDVLAGMGFEHRSEQQGDDWVIEFRRSGPSGPNVGPHPPCIL